MHQVTVSLEDKLLAFIDRYAEGDRISYIQNLLSEYCTAKLNQEIRLSLEADRDNPEYQSELELWDCVIGDGIHTERLWPNLEPHPSPLLGKERARVRF
jgi:hypothetical protein